MSDTESADSGLIEIVASEVGNPESDRLTVLFAHGGGQTRHAWERSINSLASRGYHCLAYDQRGHGDSDRSPSANYRLSDFTRDQQAILSQIEGPVCLVGASLGGLAAMRNARHRNLAALVLVDITPTMAPSGVDRIVGFMLERVVEGFASLDEAAIAVASYQRHRTQPPSADGLKKNLRQGKDGRWRWHWDPLLFNEASGLRDTQDRSQLAEDARAIAVPTLLVRGRESDLVTPEAVEEFLTLVPHAEFQDIAGAGHMVAGDNNDQFAAAIMQFVEGNTQLRPGRSTRPCQDLPARRDLG